MENQEAGSGKSGNRKSGNRKEGNGKEGNGKAKVGFNFLKPTLRLINHDQSRTKKLITAIFFLCVMDYVQNFVRFVASGFAQIGLIQFLN